MKKYLPCVLFLCLIMASSRAAWAKECGILAGGYKLTGGVLTFDDACTSLSESAFENDRSIVSVDLSNTSVTSIGAWAFNGCFSLASVKFPASLTSIGVEAFTNCQSLTSVDLSHTSLTSIVRGVFDTCINLTSVKFPDSLTSIGLAAFFDCKNLASVKLPDSLTSIGINAFFNCNNLASIDLSNTAINSIGDYAFDNLANPSTITVKKDSKAHELLGGLSSVTGDPIISTYGRNYTTLIVADPPTPTPEPGTASGAVDMIRVVPLPEDEFGSYELDPVTGEKNYLLFHTYAICMDFLNNEELCSGYERCYHK